jgi:hypothetical protein
MYTSTYRWFLLGDPACYTAAHRKDPIKKRAQDLTVLSCTFKSLPLSRILLIVGLGGLGSLTHAKEIWFIIESKTHFTLPFCLRECMHTCCCFERETILAEDMASNKNALNERVKHLE